ncbi:MarR family winged helix-turn-helix transcriptional regulator [Actinokineospora sp. G85]|uniref:MarR family winged helix-turn-helix transcriptional regulator n=1 Tax=Actinokineospora sp. G85 TaxID=3406626 RepID=UPI003C768867
MVTPEPGAPSDDLSSTEVERGKRLANAIMGFGKQQGAFVARMNRTTGIDRSAFILLKNLLHLGPSRSRALAEAVHSDPSTVSRQVATLVKDGLVERRADPEDGRASLLAVTAAGVRLLEEQRARFALSLARMVRHWEPADLDHFIELFERFLGDHQNYLPIMISECVGPTRSEGESR